MKGESVEIRVGLGSCGVASGGEPVYAALLDQARRAAAGAVVKRVGCNGMCHLEPMVEIVEHDNRATLYANVTPSMAREIARRHVRPRTAAGWFDRYGARRFRHAGDDVDAHPVDRRTGAAAAYLAKQHRIVLENCGEIDPLDIGEYIARDGYRALERCVTATTPDDVIDTVTRAGLRGRGGAGFPTGLKWSIARAASAKAASAKASASQASYVICNGDEGDPGAFMDRLVLESDPHRVVEGLAIAAYAIGAVEGFFYVRAEYPLAVRRIRTAIRDAEARGFLGASVCGSAHSLHLEVREGAGAFVCGEETALILSLEGQRGMPRLRPPFPAERGFRGQPDPDQQRGNACRDPLDCPARCRGVRGARHDRRARARKCSRSPAKSSTAGSSRCRWASRFGRSSRTSAAASSRDAASRRSRSAARRAGASRSTSPTRPSTTTPSRARAPSWDRAVSWFSTTATAWWTWRASSCVSRNPSRAASARSAGSAPSACWRFSIGCARGRGARTTSRNWKCWPTTSAAAACAAWARRLPIRSRRRSGIFATSTRRTSTGAARRDAAPRSIEYRITDKCIGCTLCAQACPVDAIAYRPYERHDIDSVKCTRCDMCFQACKDDAIEIGPRT